MKINFGALRYIGIRAFQITAYASMILLTCGVKGGILQVLILFVVGFLYAIFDYFKVIPQEQSFALRKNPEFQRHMREIKELLDKRPNA